VAGMVKFTMLSMKKSTKMARDMLAKSLN